LADSKPALVRAISHLEKGEWQPAHVIVQDETGALAAWLHGIVHLMEGDESNARYWYQRAKRAFPDKPVIKEELAKAKKAVGAP
jgi:hypothetical protein